MRLLFNITTTPQTIHNVVHTARPGIKYIATCSAHSALNTINHRTSHSLTDDTTERTVTYLDSHSDSERTESVDYDLERIAADGDALDVVVAVAGDGIAVVDAVRAVDAVHVVAVVDDGAAPSDSAGNEGHSDGASHEHSQWLTPGTVVAVHLVVDDGDAEDETKRVLLVEIGDTVHLLVGDAVDIHVAMLHDMRSSTDLERSEQMLGVYPPAVHWLCTLQPERQRRG